MSKGTPVTDLRRHFESKIVSKAGGHWLLSCNRNSKGYAVISTGGGVKKYAHRVAYELYVGPIPEGLVIDHECEIRWCCNPEHLRPMTNAGNIRRAYKQCKRGHDLNDPEVAYINRSGRRICRPCQNIRNAARFRSRVSG